MRAALLALWAGTATVASAQGGAPLSAIDWLSQSVAPAPAAPRPPDEPPVAQGAASPGITVTSLDRPPAAATGLLPPEATGLAPDIWAASPEADLLPLIRAERADTLPALNALLVTLMLAQAGPPADALSGEAMRLARVDRLLDLGALPDAAALLEAGDLLDPEAFRRWFDVALLTGSEARACAVLRDNPSLAPTLMARVFCLARNGDWPAAALTLGTARALGDVSPEDEDLLARFLDPEVADEAGPLMAPVRPTPLVFRLREAIGDGMPTASLPLAFAHADLRPTAAWRARIEAAERLARAGALGPEALRGIYMEARPAASGGVWDRAAAIQRLDAALEAEDAAAVAAALPPAWAAMEERGLEAPFASLYGARLAALPLGGEAARVAFAAGLLASAPAEPSTEVERLWAAIARGEVAGLDAPDALTAAVVAGLSDAAPPDDVAALIAEGRRGEAALRAVAAFGAGLDGDDRAVEGALASLRALGLGDVARRAAIELLVIGGGR